MPLITDFSEIRITVKHRDAAEMPEEILLWLSARCGPSRPVGGIAQWGVDQYWDLPAYLADEFKALCAKHGVK